MLTSRIIVGTPKVLKRNIGILAPALQKASDPIQQLFLDKIKEYRDKNADGKLLQSDPEAVNQMKAELDKIAKQYNASNSAEMSKFPTFNFPEPKIEMDMQKSQ